MHLYNLKKSVSQNDSSQIAIAYSVVPRGIFKPLNWCDQPNIEPKLLERRPAEKFILSHSRYFKF